MSGLFQIIRSAVTSGGYEAAPYTVIKVAQGYEERLYPAQKWVRMSRKDISLNSATRAMFRNLFNYISGENDQKIKVPMTAPVSVLIEPGAGPNCESTFTMAFYIPPQFQEKTPMPTDADVSIEERPEMRVLARTFSGFGKDADIAKEHANLIACLCEDDKELIRNADHYYYAGYDAPFKLFFRRNEIWIPVHEVKSTS